MDIDRLTKTTTLVSLPVCFGERYPSTQHITQFSTRERGGGSGAKR